jgi:hypothetical protein
MARDARPKEFEARLSQGWNPRSSERPRFCVSTEERRGRETLGEHHGEQNWFLNNSLGIDQ